MLDFVFGRMFFWDLFCIGVIATVKLPKRRYYPARLALAFAGCTGISCIWSVIFSGGNSGFGIMMLNYAGVYLIVMAALAFCVQMNSQMLFYMGAGIWFVQHCANCVDMAFLANGMNWASFLRHAGAILLAAALAYALLWRKLDVYTLSRISFGMAAPVWLGMCLVCLVLNSYAATYKQTSVSFYMADLMCNLAGLLYQNSIYMLLGLQREQEETRRLLRESKMQYEAARSKAELTEVKNRAAQQEGAAAGNAALAQLEEAVEVYDSAVSTGSPVLDVILYEKGQKCRSLGIGFTCMADGRGLDGMATTDLYALFGNALDNAIDAASRLTDSQKKHISLVVRRTGDLTTVSLQNYTADKLSFVDGLPLTTKADRQNHGFGVKSMRMLAQKYEGELFFRQEDDVVTFSMVLPVPEKEAAASGEKAGPPNRSK